jgi:adenylate cyclase
MIDALQRASQLNPSDPVPYRLLGIYLALRGRSEDAIANSTKAMRLSPHDPWMHESLIGMALAHVAAGRLEEAIEWAQRTLQQRPDWPIPYLVLAGSFVQIDRDSQARTAVQELLQLSPDFSLSGLELFLSAADPPLVERMIAALRKAGLPE